VGGIRAAASGVLLLLLVGRVCTFMWSLPDAEERAAQPAARLIFLGGRFQAADGTVPSRQRVLRGARGPLPLPATRGTSTRWLRTRLQPPTAALDLALCPSSRPPAQVVMNVPYTLVHFPTYESTKKLLDASSTGTQQEEGLLVEVGGCRVFCLRALGCSWICVCMWCALAAPRLEAPPGGMGRLGSPARPTGADERCAARLPGRTAPTNPVLPADPRAPRFPPQLLAGGAAGGLAAAVTTPLDLVKTRLQLEGMGSAMRYATMSVVRSGPGGDAVAAGGGGGERRMRGWQRPAHIPMVLAAPKGQRQRGKVGATTVHAPLPSGACRFFLA
jgi:hypothetical protein